MRDLNVRYPIVPEPSFPGGPNRRYQ